MKFKSEDIIEKFGQHTQCYLTGKPIDLLGENVFHFDHKQPLRQGGDNSIDNLGITTKEANMAKADLTQEQFLALCKEVLEHDGYEVHKIDTCS